MEEQKNRNGAKSIASILRDSLAVMFRRRQVIRRTFLWTLLGALLAIWLFAVKYESDMEVMARPLARTVPGVTPDNNPRPTPNSDANGTTIELTTEQEILQSEDLLERVVVTCDLQDKWYTHYIDSLMSWVPNWKDQKIPKAITKLSNEIEVNPVENSGVIEVSYTNSDPDRSACVMRALGTLYMQKHLATNRPPQVFGFFAQETDDYRKQLYTAERRLLGFDRAQQAVEAQTQLNNALQQESQFLASLRKTQASISALQEQVRADQSLIASTPPRVQTHMTRSDNGSLIAQLKSNLNNLENQRIALLVQYDPTFPLVQEIETQIAQTQAAITAAEQGPLHEDTTDQNPTYKWLFGDLAGARVNLASAQGDAEATGRMVKAYHDEALALDPKQMTEQDLVREINADQGNYLLYLTKREQARISDMLDARAISNVVLEEEPTVPMIPTFTPTLLIALGVLAALFLAIGMGFLVDYLDPSFRTPDEVKEFLDIPVFASIPENGREVPAGPVEKNRH